MLTIHAVLHSKYIHYNADCIYNGLCELYYSVHVAWIFGSYERQGCHYCHGTVHVLWYTEVRINHTHSCISRTHSLYLPFIDVLNRKIILGSNKLIITFNNHN